MSAPLSPSGLPTVDARWGGLIPGGAYLLVGRAGAGRSALALQAACTPLSTGGRALLMSPRTPDALAEVGTGVGIDLRAAHATGRLRLLRIPAAAELAARGSDGLDRAYTDLIGLVEAERPERVVIEDFTPLVQFDTFDRFQTAFAGLVDRLRAAGATLVVGLGEPANDASEHLLSVVREAVDGTVTLVVDETSRRLDLHRRSDAPAEPVAPVAPVAAPTAEAPAPPAPPVAAPTAAPPAMPAAPSVAMPAPAAPPEPVAPPVAQPTVPPYTPPSHDTGDAGSDGSSVDLREPEAPPPGVLQPRRRASDTGSGSDHLPRTRIVPPPAVDPVLLEPAGDSFGYDPAVTMFEQGYLVDSGAGSVVGYVPASSAPQMAAPTFAPIGAPAPAESPEEAVRQTLDSAFAARATGTPFLVVAVRMEPMGPEGARFPTIADGLRRALRPQDRLLADAARRRAVVVMPNSAADAAGPLFASLQAHLRETLGAEAEGVLRAVGAVSVPDGQPFMSTKDLLAYAYES